MRYYLYSRIFYFYNMKNNFIILLAAVCFLFSACKKDNPISSTENQRGRVKLKFDHIVGGRVLQLGSATYTNAAAENYTIETLRYYISNIKLTRQDGTVYTVPKDSSYFLIDASVENSLFPKFQVPVGTYTKLDFILGVDSLKNTEDIASRLGDLSVDKGMYWSWNSGYIFLKMEGKSAASSSGNYHFHIGGFGGYNTQTINNIKAVSVDLTKAGSSAVQEGLSSDIHLMVDVSLVLDGKTPFSIKEHPSVMFGEFSTSIADNYQAMFRHDHTHNFQKIAGE